VKPAEHFFGLYTMAYRLKINETPEHALHRIGLNQINRAIHALSAAEAAHSTIHETRKCLKRIRALLRLVRPGLGESDFQAGNARYRDIAQRLSHTRDAQILMETFLKLEPFASASDATAIAPVKLAIETKGSSGTSLTDPAAFSEAREQLSQSKAALAKLSIKADNFDPIKRGLRDCYRKGRDRYERAYRDGTDDSFHDLRKSVQLHWRQMALMSRAWPEMFSARVEAARQLSQILGDSQDLSVLLKYVSSLPPSVVPEKSASRFEHLAHKRQKSLRAMAKPRCAQLFSLPPKAFARSVVDAWQAACAIEALADDSPPEADVDHAVVTAPAPPPQKATPEPDDVVVEKITENPPAARRKRSRAPA
jgi:CHAD domain-containing protein